MPVLHAQKVKAPTAVAMLRRLSAELSSARPSVRDHNVVLGSLFRSAKCRLCLDGLVATRQQRLFNGRKPRDTRACGVEGALQRSALKS